MAFKFSYFSRETSISLRRNPLMTVAGILTVAVSLFLFGGVLLLSAMVEHGTSRWKDEVEFEIFMVADATDTQIKSIEAELKRSPEVKDYRFLTKADAFKEFKRMYADEPEVLENVDPDILPPSFRVVPDSAELTEEVAVRFDGRPGVDDVMTASEQVDRVLKAISWVRRLFFGIAGVQLASALVLIVNTIRLATVARRREIEVMKLVGATNWFIRVPYMAEGLIQGLIGATAAFTGIYVLKLILSNLVRNSKNLFNTFYVTNADALSIGLTVLLIGALVGAIGSAIGLRRLLEV